MIEESQPGPEAAMGGPWLVLTHLSELDQSLYAAVKLNVYRQLKEKMWRARNHPSGQSLDEEARRLVSQAFTARRVRRLIEAKDSQGRPVRYTDFYTGTPQLFYRRLLSLNHGKVLKAGSTKFRRSRVFIWNEGILPKNLCTMEALESTLGRRYDLGVDLLRLYEEFGDGPFHRDQFVDLFQRMFRSAMQRHDVAEKKVEKVSGSTDFLMFLRERFDELFTGGFFRLISGSSPVAYQLNQRGFETALYLDFFLHNIGFSDSVPQCPHCQSRPTPGAGASPAAPTEPPAANAPSAPARNPPGRIPRIPMQ